LIVRDVVGVLVVFLKGEGLVVLLVVLEVEVGVEFVLTDGEKVGKRSFVEILEVVLEVKVDRVIVEFVVFEVLLSIYF